MTKEHPTDTIIELLTAADAPPLEFIFYLLLNMANIFFEKYTKKSSPLFNINGMVV